MLVGTDVVNVGFVVALDLVVEFCIELVVEFNADVVVEFNADVVVVAIGILVVEPFVGAELFCVVSGIEVVVLFAGVVVLVTIAVAFVIGFVVLEGAVELVTNGVVNGVVEPFWVVFEIEALVDEKFPV